ncbi:MAG: fumarylacetoacetate hydrolase family protein [Armatimonadetes bacterium]|nr:fumarylacetoacetate hydrolase family protein [Armatimonadota bacterium]
MKLCRFELKSQPGTIRSGIIYGGKVYETDGSQPIAVHEAEDVIPLSPMGQPGSVRFFRQGDQRGHRPQYFYGNPNSVIGPSQVVELPQEVGAVDVEAYLAIVVTADGRDVAPDDALAYVLGYSLAVVLVDRAAEREEQALNLSPARSYDVAIAFGPALTTPDEIVSNFINKDDENLISLTASLSVNGVEVHKAEADHLTLTVESLITAASSSAPIRAGELLLYGPLLTGSPQALTQGDEVRLAVENLGALFLKISETL